MSGSGAGDRVLAPRRENSLRNHENGQTGVVQPLLTDLYQITMAYALWRTGKADRLSVYNLFFRKSPFLGEYTIFCGLEECLKYLENFHFSKSDLDYLRQVLPDTVEEEFYTYLSRLDARDITVRAIPEGSVVFPRVPLVQLEGPHALVQLVETTFLTLVNFASLVATNAARFRLAAGTDKVLLEFGLRRAQGPDGGLSASKYCYVGGFDGTSNVLAGKMFNIPVRGTHAHAFVSSFTNMEDISERDGAITCAAIHIDNVMQPRDKSKPPVAFADLCLQWRERVAGTLGYLKEEANDGELAAFISYAMAFPEGFLALVDTYDTLRSGLVNYCAVACALNDLGYQPYGIRIDSGDLAYLSNMARKHFKKIATEYSLPWFATSTIVASNDINEDTLCSLNEQGHSITCYGVGTHLVTCQKQPALGCVFKLVEIGGKPKIKLSQDLEKVTIPGAKAVYRLYGKDGKALIDLIQRCDENVPVAGERVLCRHPFHEPKRAYVVPAKVEQILQLFWQGGKLVQPLPTLSEVRKKVQVSLNTLRDDHKRHLNPTPYKVSVTDNLYNFLHELWLENAPIGELY